MPMKPVLPLLVCLALAPAVQAQSTTVDVDVTLESPSASCAFSVTNDLDFGDVEKPTAGSGSVTVNEVTGARSSSGVTVSGSSTVGQVRLYGSHASSYTVSRTFPSSLKRSNKSLTFSGTWAQSSSASSGYSTISASSYAGTGGGSGTTFSRHFRFGGQVSGITWSSTNGDYTGSISTSATCN